MQAFVVSSQVGFAITGKEPYDYALLVNRVKSMRYDKLITTVLLRIVKVSSLVESSDNDLEIVMVSSPTRKR